MNNQMNHDEGQEEMMDRNNNSILGFIVGAAVGAGLALLLAPAAGVDTRRRLGQTAKRWGTSARDGVQHARDKMSDLRTDVTDRVDGIKEDVQTAVGAGREAFAREREARFDGKTSPPRPTA